MRWLSALSLLGSLLTAPCALAATVGSSPIPVTVQGTVATTSAGGQISGTVGIDTVQPSALMPVGLHPSASVGIDANRNTVRLNQQLSGSVTIQSVDPSVVLPIAPIPSATLNVKIVGNEGTSATIIIGNTISQGDTNNAGKAVNMSVTNTGGHGFGGNSLMVITTVTGTGSYLKVDPGTGIFPVRQNDQISGSVTIQSVAAGVGIRTEGQISGSVTIQSAAASVLLPVGFNPSASVGIDANRNTVKRNAISLTVTVTGAADAGVTLSLPAVASEFHYISSIEILKYVTTGISASANPIIVTTTNLRSMDFNLRRTGALADVEALLYQPSNPIKSAVVNTASTLVFPAVTGVKWIATVQYYTAP